MGLRIHTLIDEKLDWLAHGDDVVDVDGYFNYLWEAQENLAAMCAQATAAVAGDLLAHSSILELGPVTYPSELIGAQIEVSNQGREQH